MRKIAIVLSMCIGMAQAAEVTERQTIRKSFTLPANGKLVVDNVWGSVKVTGVSGTQVRATIEEELRADSPAKG